MKKYTILALITACLFLISLVNVSFAVKKAVGTSTNIIETSTVQGKIVNEYETAVQVYPGNTIKDIVHIKNTGTSACVVRVKVDKAWGTRREEDGKLIIDSSVSTDNILISFNNATWVYDDKSGYFYYNSVLYPEQLTSEPLFDSFHITKETDNHYADLTADILINLECLQATEDAVSVWDKLPDDFQNMPSGYNKPKPTKVNYIGIDKGFSFEALDNDLFYNFKQLLPGETRNQLIEVANISTRKTEIFLRADSISIPTDEKQQQLVEKMLREYASIKIYNGEILIYEGPVSGDSMKQDISLGVFEPGAYKELSVQLQMDTAMGNQYQDLWGAVTWIWSAQEDDNGQSIEQPGEKPGVRPDPGYPGVRTPKTGESLGIYIWAMLTLLSAILFVFCITKIKRQKISVKI